jgi:outer membrane protein
MASTARSYLKVAACALLALAAATAPSTAASDGRAEIRVGVVDATYAVQQTEDGIRASNTLRKLFEKRQKDVDAKKAELEKMYDDIERQQRILSREAFARRMEDFQKRTADFQSQFLKYSEELQKKQAELLGPINQRMTRVTGRIAKKNGFDVIVNAGAVLYVRSDLNVTDQVIQMYNGGGDGGDDAGDDKKDKKDKKDEAPKDAPTEAPKEAPKP